MIHVIYLIIIFILVLVLVNYIEQSKNHLKDFKESLDRQNKLKHTLFKTINNYRSSQRLSTLSWSEFDRKDLDVLELLPYNHIPTLPKKIVESKVGRNVKTTRTSSPSSHSSMQVDYSTRSSYYNSASSDSSSSSCSDSGSSSSSSSCD